MGPLDEIFDMNGDGELDGLEMSEKMDFIDYLNDDGIYEDDMDDDTE